MRKGLVSRLAVHMQPLRFWPTTVAFEPKLLPTPILTLILDREPGVFFLASAVVLRTTSPSSRNQTLGAVCRSKPEGRVDILEYAGVIVNEAAAQVSP